jgi:hypothetical protein
MGDDQLRLYRTLSRAPFPKSYVGKVFLTAFFGTHVPLLALLVYFVRDRRFGLGGALRILSVTVDQAGAGAHRRGPAREPRSAARRRRDAPHLQRRGVPVEAG